MQKTFTLVALALTLSCAFAYINVNGSAYSKAPQSVASNTDINFTNSTGLSLASINAGELDLIAYNYTKNDNNGSAGTYNAAWRKLDGKTLSASTNSTGQFTGTSRIATIVNGFAIYINLENDTSAIPQVIVYQSSVTGGAAVARVIASSNTNNTFNPVLAGLGLIGKTFYIFYTAAEGFKVNVTNFVAGGAKGSLEFTLTSALNGSVPLNVVWGESLGSSQLFANWQEGITLKDATIDVSKGTVTANTVGAWQLGYGCTAYATDKKWFGDICWTSTNGTQSVYVRSNTTSLALLTTNNQSLSGIQGVLPYGPYLAVLYTDRITTQGNTTYSYDIWNLDTYAAYRNRTTFITSDKPVNFFRIVSAGFYTFTSDSNVVVGNVTYLYQNIQVGLVLGASYLTTVLGFIMTIVAGLLLF